MGATHARKEAVCLQTFCSGERDDLGLNDPKSWWT